LEHLSKQKFDEKLKGNLISQHTTFTGYTYNETKNNIPAIDESFELTANNYSSVTGKRVFLKPNLLTYNSGKLDTSEQRKYDIVLSHSFKHIDSITINLAF
jgi:hypothetical protein